MRWVIAMPIKGPGVSLQPRPNVDETGVAGRYWRSSQWHVRQRFSLLPVLLRCHHLRDVLLLLFSTAKARRKCLKRRPFRRADDPALCPWIPRSLYAPRRCLYCRRAMLKTSGVPGCSRALQLLWHAILVVFMTQSHELRGQLARTSTRYRLIYFQRRLFLPADQGGDRRLGYAPS